MSEPDTNAVATQEQAPPPAPPVKMDRPAEARAYNLVETLGRAYCNDDDSLARCVDLDKAIAQTIKAVDDDHKAATEGLTAAKRYLDEKRRKVKKALEDSRTYIQKELIGPYRKQKEIEAQQEAERLRKEHEDKTLQTAEELEAQGKADEAAEVLEEGADLASSVGTTQQVGPVRGHTAGTASFRTEWFFEIEDADKVPREFCSPDEKKIREAIRRSDNPVREMDGVRIYSEEVMTNR